MKPATQIAASLLIILCTNFCRQQEEHPLLYFEADSLLRLTMELQSRIGSPEIQRMQEFREEIKKDLALLSPAAEQDTSLQRYLELYDKIGQCMQACNHYHEEAFMLESSLREILKQVQSEDRDLEELRDLLNFEKGNYTNLSERLNSSMNQAISQAEIYYSMKPGINQIRDRLPPSHDPRH